jgi:hypothetical protein
MQLIQMDNYNNTIFRDTTFIERTIKEWKKLLIRKYMSRS